MKRYIVLLAFIVIALASLRSSTPAQAHTRFMPYHPAGTLTLLKTGIYGNYYFSPTYITCRVLQPCFTVVNRTGRVVILVNGFGQPVARLWPGTTFSEIYYRPGVYTVTDIQHNIRVPLNVSVIGFWPMRPAILYHPTTWQRQPGWRRF